GLPAVLQPVERADAGIGDARGGRQFVAHRTSLPIDCRIIYQRPAAVPSEDTPMPHPTIWLARHGETEWSLSGQHTGLTDLPLTDRSERNARKLGEQLRLRQFARVFTSPL